MDDKLATQFFDSTPLLGIEPEHDPSLPRYLIVLSGGTPGSMLALSPGGSGSGAPRITASRVPEPSVSRRHAGLASTSPGTPG